MKLVNPFINLGRNISSTESDLLNLNACIFILNGFQSLESVFICRKMNANTLTLNI